MIFHKHLRLHLQDSNADIDFTKLLDDHFVAERLTMCLRHDPNKRLTPEGWFGHLSMWRDNADKMKTTMELLAWCVKGLPEFEKFAQEVLGPMLDKGRFEVRYESVNTLTCGSVHAAYKDKTNVDGYCRACKVHKIPTVVKGTCYVANVT